jgi:DNA repair exonuclease SbcCD ATPase subunit
MPRLLCCNPTGFFSYGLHHNIPLDNQGLCLLNGLNQDRGSTSNGAGKSSFFNAICQILFGKNPSGEVGEAVINEFLGRAFGRIIFLDDDGQKWRITDTKKWRKTDKYPDDQDEPSELHGQGLRYSGTDVYLERWDGSVWKDERNTNSESGAFRLDLKATRRKITEILRLNYEQFISIGYMAQRQSLKFIRGTHKERLEVLSDLANLHVWSKRVEQIREDIHNLEGEQDKIDAQLVGLRTSGTLLNAPNPQELTEHEAHIARLEVKIDLCDEAIALLSIEKHQWDSKLAALDQGISKYTQTIRQKTILQQQLQEPLESLTKKYIEDCKVVRDRPRNLELVSLETQIAEFRGVAQARRFDLEQLLTGAGKCPRCRSAVTVEHLNRHRELLQIEIREQEEKVKLLNEKLTLLNQDEEKKVKEDLDKLSVEYYLSKNIIDCQINQLVAEIHQLSQDIERLREEKEKAGDSPQHRIDQQAQTRLSFLSEKARYEDRARTWHEQQKKHGDHQEIIQRSAARLLQISEAVAYRQALDKLFGDKGFKAWKLNAILDELNQVLREYVAILTDHNVSLWVTQYREKTDGESTADIQIMVREGQKKDVPFNLYSGGEQQQITLAFIGAFWELASRHGVGINTLFLDEVIANLDTASSQLTFNFLEHMRIKGKSTVVIVTHNPQIQDQIHFDQIWTVTKIGGMSKLQFN